MGQINTITVDGTIYDVADKRLTECAVTANGQFFLTATASNNPGINRMSHKDAANALLPNLADNVFIAYYGKDWNSPKLAKLEKWKELEAAGEIAAGVALVEGDKIMVIAPTDAILLWSSSAVEGGGTVATNVVDAVRDWNGKANTAAQILHDECNTAEYAAGYCHKYSRGNANNQGLTAGKWWLPSIGELFMIFRNFKKVKYAMSLISGADQLREEWTWSSTEQNASNAWYLDFNDGSIGTYLEKFNGERHVRPVSEWGL